MKNKKKSINTIVREKVYRVQKNNFDLAYDSNKDEFFIGIRDFPNLALKDIKDLHNLTRRLLRYTKNEK